MKYYWCVLAALALAPHVRGAAPLRVLYRVETVAGSARTGDGGPAIAAQLSNILGVAADRFGNVYISEPDNHRIRKISQAGVITTFAGTGVAGFSGDGGPAGAAQLNLPYGLAADLAGYVYVADLGNQRVRRINPQGIIVTVAGTGRKGASSDGGAATEATLLTPRNVAVDAAGNLYFSEFEGHRVRKVAPDGRISTVAGTGLAGFRGDGGSALSAQLSYPAGLAIDRFGALHIADSGNNRVRKIFDSGVIGTVLGGSSSTALATPLAIAVDLGGTVYAGDSSFVVRAYTAAGKWSDFAGTATPGFSGDGGPALKATITAVHDLASDLSGNLWIADGVRLRKVDLNGAVQTVAGDGYQRALGDGGTATGGILYQPSAIALDSAGNLYIADTGTQRVRQVLASGTMTTLAGTGTAGAGTDGSAANAGALNGPMAVAIDFGGNVLIADTNNHRIQQVASGRMRTVAGTGAAGMGPDAMLPLATQLRGPRAICMNRAGILFIVDTANHRVLRAPPGGLIETAAGNGSPGDTGDGGPARLAQLNQPGACQLDSYGNLFIADTGSHRIRKVTAAGAISTVAGSGAAGGSGDEGPATAASLSAPRGVAVDDSGDIFIADTGNHRIRQVTPDGAIHSIAGNAAGFAGDGGAALAAQLNSPGGLFLDGAGALYFADTNNNRVRRLVPDGVVPPAPIVLLPTISAVNALSMRQGPVAPGEIVSIFGQGIGPVAAVTGNFDAAGLLANLVGGVEVRFDGVAAPIFYAQASQINVQVPYTVAGARLTRLEVWVQGKTAGILDLPVAAASPALLPFGINQDGSLNSETVPAPRGTVLTFYATGEGLTDGPNITGKAAEAPYPRPLLPVTFAVAGVAAEILFAGSAPAMVGVMQINARMPGGFVAPGQAVVELSVGGAAASAITIWLK